MRGSDHVYFKKLVQLLVEGVEVSRGQVGATRVCGHGHTLEQHLEIDHSNDVEKELTTVVLLAGRLGKSPRTEP